MQLLHVPAPEAHVSHGQHVQRPPAEEDGEVHPGPVGYAAAGDQPGEVGHGLGDPDVGGVRQAVPEIGPYYLAYYAYSASLIWEGYGTQAAIATLLEIEFTNTLGSVAAGTIGGTLLSLVLR